MMDDLTLERRLEAKDKLIATLKSELRDERRRLLLEMYNNSKISQFQFDQCMKELDDLAKGD